MGWPKLVTLRAQERVKIADDEPMTLKIYWWNSQRQSFDITR
jgi:hypothetical protein